MVFRSDHLSRLTVAEQQILQHLQFNVACDLRSVRKQNRAPDFLPPDGSICLLPVPIQAHGFDPATAMEDYLQSKAGLDETTICALRACLLE